MKFDKVIKIIFILICISFIIIPLIKTDYIGGKKSNTENRMLADGLGALFNEKKDNFSVTKWIDDNIGFRNYMLYAKSYLNYNIMNISPVTKVAIGKDGWLFYTLENNLLIPTGKFPLDNKSIDNITYNMYKCQQNLENMGIKFITTIAPAKTSIYPEYIKGLNKISDTTPADIIRNNIMAGTNFVDIKSRLIDYKLKYPDDLLYYKGDTHWTGLGGYIGYLSILDKINNALKNDNISIKVAEIVYKKRTGYTGDIINMLGGIKPHNIAYDYNIPYIDSPNYKKNDDGKKELIKYTKLKENNIDYFINEKSDNKKTILILGDSFRIAMKDFFAESFYKTIVLGHGIISQELINNIKPDVVLILNTERYTNAIYRYGLSKCAYFQ